MTVPSNPLALMQQVYRRVFPIVHDELAYWTDRAEEIPDPELRKQALASISSKTFHCEGGAILSLLAEENKAEAIKFIVAYQTISDYLDNLCDRSTSMDPDDFRALHQSMDHALTIDAVPVNYYRNRNEQDDGGYLQELVLTCQEMLRINKHYHEIYPFLTQLCSYYCDLQVHKHVMAEERVPRLKTWFNSYKKDLPSMTWYEFSACSGSTLGIFCLISYGLRNDFKPRYATEVMRGYFPYIQGLHILLDYFIDQEEDRHGGDLNFCFYYKNEEEMVRRLSHFVEKSSQHVDNLPHSRFHKLIQRGLLGLYLSDNKVQSQKTVRPLAKRMIRLGGIESLFFYLNGKVYRSLQKRMAASRIVFSSAK
ncbi:tetraprenyl-beta-curcumene synthase family protein [Peribacillus saganii]|uniref:Tetraprenyl-beta-curcumene synthase family protein n=1 Tax=Peribacillus saganii TaxID=2303992 RepID=A0A372LPV0_9BACI|nr:tetraprenyl-beta-curcumene synthase family protein [Peribacillus saganii]RFU68705.1 tetraprenyl-beta-curcumene synthase family protein [Peribacillus saganii]